MPEQSPVAPSAVLDTYLALLNGPWTRTLLPGLRRSRFLAYLYGLHAHADPTGLIRARDGCADVADSLARASCARLTDSARFLAAALAAGVITERAPGRYALVTTVTPDWGAAAAVLTPETGSSAA